MHTKKGEKAWFQDYKPSTITLIAHTCRGVVLYLLVKFSEQSLRICFLGMNIEILLFQSPPPAQPE